MWRVVAHCTVACGLIAAFGGKLQELRWSVSRSDHSASCVSLIESSSLNDARRLVTARQSEGIIVSGIVAKFLRATAGTAIARLSHRNSVCPSVCHTGGSGKNGAS